MIAEAILMTVSGITLEQMKDSMFISFLMLFFAICFVFAKELLPTYYDNNKINFVSQGILRIHMRGLAFNNGNWIYVLNIFRAFTLGIAIIAPIICYLSISIGGVDLWNRIKFPSMAVLFIALVITTYIVGKKYE